MRETRTDLFGHRYWIEMAPYAGLDYSRKCFVFPGQGAIEPGVGASDLERFPVLQRRFDIADQLARTAGVETPSSYLRNFKGIASEERPMCRNLALYAMSVGLFEVAIASGVKPALLTAHSFGEFAVFAASGLLSFEDGFRAVIERERACPVAGTIGSMIAVSASREQVLAATKLEPRWIANINSPSQTVLSVPSEEIKNAALELKRARLAFRILEAIPQPYHSFLLKDSAERFATWLASAGLSFHAPKIPVLSSVTGKIIDRSSFSPAEARTMLATQLITPVHFDRQIHEAVRFGCRSFVELAHNRICSPWIGEILRNEPHKIRVLKVLESAPYPAANSTSSVKHDKKLVGFLNRVIAAVTGYSIEEISLSKNFQEDLGIDSIKKAEIVLNFIESQGQAPASLSDGLAMHRIRTVEDVLSWYESAQSFGTSSPEAEEFAAYRAIWVDAPVASFGGETEGDVQFMALQDLQAPEPGPRALVFYDDGSQLDVFRAIAWFRSQYELFGGPDRVRRMGLVIHDESSAATKGLSAFLASLAAERSCPFKIVHTESADFDRAADLSAEFMTPRLTQTRRGENGSRKVLRYEAILSQVEAPTPSGVSAVGGASGITFEILKDLASRGTRRIFIMGRRHESEILQALGELRRAGAEVTYLQGNAGTASDLRAFLKFESNVLILASGTLIEALLPAQTDEQMKTQIASKLDALEILAALESLPTTICFSSLAGELGPGGLAAYAYANKAMSALAQQLWREKRLDVRVIDWPSWDHIGMTAQESTYRGLVLRKERFLSRDEGCAFFRMMLAAEPGSHWTLMDGGTAEKTGVFAANESQVRAVFPDRLRSPIHLSNWTLSSLPALADHLILDQPLVPVSLVIASLVQLGRFLSDRPMEIQNLEALAFMAVHRRDSPYVLGYRFISDKTSPSSVRSENLEIDCEIRSSQTHIKARLGTMKSLAADVRIWNEPAETYAVNMNLQAYSCVGPKLHLLRRVRVDAFGNAYADLDCAEHVLFPGSKSANTQMVLCEALLHLAAAWVEGKTARVSIPIHIDSISFYDADFSGVGVCRLYCSCSESAPELFSANLFAVHPSGRVLVVLRAVRIRLGTKGFSALSGEGSLASSR